METLELAYIQATKRQRQVESELEYLRAERDAIQKKIEKTQTEREGLSDVISGLIRILPNLPKVEGV